MCIYIYMPSHRQATAVLDQYNIEPKIKAALLKNIERRLTPTAIKIRADLEVTCFNYEGE